MFLGNYDALGLSGLFSNDKTDGLASEDFIGVQGSTIFATLLGAKNYAINVLGIPASVATDSWVRRNFQSLIGPAIIKNSFPEYRVVSSVWAGSPYEHEATGTMLEPDYQLNVNPNISLQHIQNPITGGQVSPFNWIPAGKGFSGGYIQGETGETIPGKWNVDAITSWHLPMTTGVRSTQKMAIARFLASVVTFVAGAAIGGALASSGSTTGGVAGSGAGAATGSGTGAVTQTTAQLGTELAIAAQTSGNLSSTAGYLATQMAQAGMAIPSITVLEGMAAGVNSALASGVATTFSEAITQAGGLTNLAASAEKPIQVSANDVVKAVKESVTVNKPVNVAEITNVIKKTLATVATAQQVANMVRQTQAQKGNDAQEVAGQVAQDLYNQGQIAGVNKSSLFGNSGIESLIIVGGISAVLFAVLAKLKN